MPYDGTDQTGIASGSGTGAHGVTGAGVPDLFGGVWHWINKPFTSPMDPLSVFLVVGVVLIAIILWNLILYHIRIAAETIID